MLKYKYLTFNKEYSNRFNEKFKKKFRNRFKFSNNNINNFILLLRKSVYIYEYMDDWEKFNETKLLEKEEFYSKLNLEDITDANYMYPKRICKDFEIKYWRNTIKTDVILPADVFKKFRKMCSEVYELDPVKFISALGLAWQTALKKQVLN